MYFSKFPVFQYPVTFVESNTSDSLYGVIEREGQVLVRNIIRRVSLSENIQNDSSIFSEYYVADGERPEHVARRVYGDEQYHWIVLLTNKVIDPYHKWCKSSEILHNYASVKYHGYSLFVSSPSGNFFSGDGIYPGSHISQNGKSVRILNYNSTLSKVTVHDAGFVGGTASLGIYGQTLANVYIRRVLPSLQAVHHFETQTENTVDSLSEEIGPSPAYLASSSSLVSGSSTSMPGVQYQNMGKNISGISFSQTYLGKYMGISGPFNDSFSVTNTQYEESKNESLRKIKLLNPLYKMQAIQELKKMMEV